MITTSAEYKNAIDAPSRRIIPKCMIDLSDPDLVVTSVTGDVDSTYSFPNQLTDKDMEFSGSMYATLEACRWVLDGTQKIMPDDPSTRTGEQGVIGSTLCGVAGDFTNATMTIQMTGVDTLQMVTVASPARAVDGYPTNMTLEIYSGNLLLYSTTEDTGRTHWFHGFTVTQPNKIVLTINSWSLPRRRFRLVESLPGMLEAWGGETIHSMNIIQRGDFSNLTIPYATANLSINNTDHRFDPADKASIFASVVARQPIPLWYGVEVEGTVEYVPCGIYYQQNEGWQIQNDGLTINWNLIDIIGILADRHYKSFPKPDDVTITDTSTYPPHQVVITPPLTKTLKQWVENIVGNLSDELADHWVVDDDLSNPYLTCEWSAIQDLTCGDILRFVCQATNSYPVSDPVTGYLTVKALNNTPTRVTTLRTQNSIAGSESNTDIAFLNFDIGGTQYSVPGTEEISDKTVNIQNPFISSTMAAVSASQLIITQYGGNILNVASRGDPSRQIGDIETLEMYPNEYVSARIIEQTLSLQDGIMTNQKVKMLQANGGQMYTDVILIDADGTYTMPAGVTEITMVLIGGGQGGSGGNGGTDDYVQDRNADGREGGGGGYIYSTPLTINDGQQIVVHIGVGGNGGKGGQTGRWSDELKRRGKVGDEGEPTTVTIGTIFSSENGVRMSTGYVDLLTNSAYAVPGQPGKNGRRRPANGSRGMFYGNGGNGGDGGMGSVWDPEPTWDENGVIVEHAQPGADGGKGANGVVLIFYAKEDAS